MLAQQSSKRHVIGPFIESMQKCDKVGFLIFAQSKRRNQIRTAWAVDTATIIKINDRFERRNRSVMHVGRAARDIA